MLPLYLSPVSLDSSLQIITQLSCYPAFQVWRYPPISLFLALFNCSCLQIYLGTYLYRPVCMGLCVDVSASGEPGVSGDFWGSQEGCQGLFLHGLESNPGSSLQTEEEAGLP